MEALESVTPPGLSLFTFFSSGTEAVEGAMRVARAATGRIGFVSFHRDFHGRTGGSARITAVRASNGPRDPMSMLVPNGHCYRCSFHLEPTHVRPAVRRLRRRVDRAEHARPGGRRWSAR